jgi:oxygen-independent coproporphyrinogen-3 oxidase
VQHDLRNHQLSIINLRFPMITSLYIHLPFCAMKCDYCAFYSFAGSTADQRQGYLQRIRDELAEKAALCGPLDTVYIGGGTPSSLTVDELTALLQAVTTHYQLAADVEFTMECNPGSVTAGKIETAQAFGVNRFSIGVQTFDSALREKIGRGGDVRLIPRAVGILKDCGVRNFNCDLIYAIPGQTLGGVEDDVRRILEFEPAHVSAYSLMIEPGTVLQKQGMSEGREDDVVTMWRRIAELLGEAGLQRYEVSNYARPGFECRHNVEIWYGGRFVGVGPSASYFVGDTRYTNIADLDRWQAGAVAEEDPLDGEARASEILATGLRLVNGWDADSYRQAAGMGWDLRSSQIRHFIDEGLLTDGDRLCPTEKGLLFNHYIARELL